MQSGPWAQQSVVQQRLTDAFALAASFLVAAFVGSYIAASVVAAAAIAVASVVVPLATAFAPFHLAVVAIAFAYALEAQHVAVTGHPAHLHSDHLVVSAFAHFLVQQPGDGALPQ